MQITTAKEYVNQLFSNEQKIVFDFLIKSFPEKLLVINDAIFVEDESNDNNDVLASLALLAYIIGDSRELIKNLEISKSIVELYNSIDPLNINYNERTVENNKVLLLLAAEQLNSPLVKNYSSIEEKIEQVIINEEAIKDSYETVRNRGTIPTIDQIVQSAISSSDNPTAQYTIDESSVAGTISILIDNIPDYADLDFPLGIFTIDGEEYFSIKRDTAMFRNLMSVRPAGMYYSVAVPVFIGDFLINYNNINTILEEYDLEPVSYLKTEIPLPTLLMTAASTVNKTYSIEITNPSKIIGLTVVIYEINADNTGTVYPEEYFIPANTTTEITKSATNSKFSLGGENTKIVAYFKSGPYTGSEVSYAPNIDLFAPPAPIVLSLIASNLTATKGFNISGGTARLTIANTNSIAVVATILYKWSSDSVYSSRSISISAGSSSSQQVFGNPYNTTQDIEFKVTLSATGYTSSPEVIKELFGVARSNDGSEEF